MTGGICARELKISYNANVVKCPITCDKSLIEFPALPENEHKEVVLEVKNTSQKALIMEIVPPHPDISGLIVNPLVVPLNPGLATLVSIKYMSKFRDFNHQAMEDMFKPKYEEGSMPAGMVVKNKKL